MPKKLIEIKTVQSRLTTMTLNTIKHKDGTKVYKCFVRYWDNKVGVWRQKTKNTGVICDGTKKQYNAAWDIAERFRDKFEKALLKEYEDDELKDDISVAEYFKLWYSMRERERDQGLIRNGTLQSNYDLLFLSNGIIPYFEKHPTTLQHLKKQDILDFRNHFLDQKTEKKDPIDQVRRKEKLIRQMLKCAVEDDYILYNVMDRIKRIKKRKKPEKAWLNYDEINDILSRVIVLEYNDYAALISAIVIAAFTGMRRSEICGLRWQFVDLKKRMIYVRRTLTQYKNEVYDEPLTKTDNGYRDAAISDELCDYLNKLKEKQKQDRKICGNTYFESDYTVRKIDGEIMKPNTLTNEVRFILQEKWGFDRVSLHTFRHSFNANMDNDGVPMTTRALAMGDDSLTLQHYTHAEKKKAAEAISKYQEKLHLPLKKKI